jgi:protein TonB
MDEPAPVIEEMTEPAAEKPEPVAEKPAPVIEEPEKTIETVNADKATPIEKLISSQIVPTPKNENPKPEERAQPTKKTVQSKEEADKKETAPEALQTKPGEKAASQPQIQGLTGGKRDERPAAIERPRGSGAARSDNPVPSPAIIEVGALEISQKVPPDYPMISRKRREQGTVVLLAEISSGAVVSVKIERSSGHSPLDESAIRALKKWRFGMPSDTNTITARIPFVFELK